MWPSSHQAKAPVGARAPQRRVAAAIHFRMTFLHKQNKTVV
jgi:hypothetical protein